jgi:phytoene desaturase
LNPKDKKKIVVIGAGFGGLSAAIRLAIKGHDVHIYEKRDRLGGRAYRYEMDGFKFDGGPTVITAPYIFDELFTAAGKNKEDYIDLVPLKTFYRFFHPDGRWLDYTGNLEALSAEVKKFEPGDVNGFKKFSAQVKKIFDFFSLYTDKPFRSMWDMLKIIPPSYRLKGHIGTYKLVSRYLRNPFLREVFSAHPLLIGGSPIDTPAFYTLIAQFEREWGLYYSMGGTYRIVEAFGSLLKEYEGQVHLNSEVKQISFNGKKADGIVLEGGQKVSADVVVCNSDLSFTYLNLIPKQNRRKMLSWRLRNMNYSVSLFVYYFGTKKKYTDSKLQHHNMMMIEDYHKYMQKLFHGKEIPEDLFLYLHMPTRTDPGIAPEGKELFYVLALVPNLRVDADWKAIGPAYRDKIIDFLEERYLPGLGENIEVDHYIDPFHFRDTLNSYKGAGFATTPVLSQTAFLRPLNKSKRYKDLYFVGAGTHPGPGVPAVISSGKIVSDLIESEIRKK